MQKIATQIFIYASIVFGVAGIVVIMTGGPDSPTNASDLNAVAEKILMTTVFIILPSFALSVAGKYLKSKS